MCRLVFASEEGTAAKTLISLSYSVTVVEKLQGRTTWTYPLTAWGGAFPTPAQCRHFTHHDEPGLAENEVWRIAKQVDEFIYHFASLEGTCGLMSTGATLGLRLIFIGGPGVMR